MNIDKKKGGAYNIFSNIPSDNVEIYVRLLFTDKLHKIIKKRSEKATMNIKNINVQPIKYDTHMTLAKFVIPKNTLENFKNQIIKNKNRIENLMEIMYKKKIKLVCRKNNYEYMQNFLARIYNIYTIDEDKLKTYQLTEFTRDISNRLRKIMVDIQTTEPYNIQEKMFSDKKGNALEHIVYNDVIAYPMYYFNMWQSHLSLLNVPDANYLKSEEKEKIIEKYKKTIKKRNFSKIYLWKKNYNYGGHNGDIEKVTINYSYYNPQTKSIDKDEIISF